MSARQVGICIVCAIILPCNESFQSYHFAYYRAKINLGNLLLAFGRKFSFGFAIAEAFVHVFLRLIIMVWLNGCLPGLRYPVRNVDIY